MEATINLDTNTLSQSEPPAAQRPDHVPEKFWDAEKGTVRVDDVLRSYAELEKGRGKPAAQEPTKAPEGTVEAPTVEQAAQQLADKGIDYAALQAEFGEKGELSPETYTRLEQAGMPKDMVDGFIAGQKAIADGHRAFALGDVGEERFGEVLGWAKDNLTPADIAAYNSLVNGAQSKEDMKAAVDNLVARFEQANGKAPALVNTKGHAPSADVYRDMSEMMRDMNDPRYHASQAFRDAVAAKLDRSEIM